MDLSPIEYVIIEFPGNRFTGEIAPAIGDLVDRGVVRILDLVFVRKDADGTISSFEYDELDETAAFAAIDGDADGVLNDDDLANLAAELDDDSSALFVVFEDLWAAELGQAVRKAGGELVAGGRIPHTAASAVLAGLARPAGEGELS